MMDAKGFRRIVISSLVLTLTTCAAPEPPPDLLSLSDSQMKLRSFQSRTFDDADRKEAIRAVIAVLQDLGFIIERANEPLGLVTAGRFAEPHYYDVAAVTVTVRPRDGGGVLIRANAIFNNKPIDDPEVYQNFFTSLEQSMFITRK